MPPDPSDEDFDRAAQEIEMILKSAWEGHSLSGWYVAALGLSMKGLGVESTKSEEGNGYTVQHLALGHQAARAVATVYFGRRDETEPDAPEDRPPDPEGPTPDEITTDIGEVLAIQRTAMAGNRWSSYYVAALTLFLEAEGVPFDLNTKRAHGYKETTLASAHGWFKKRAQAIRHMIGRQGGANA